MTRAPGRLTALVLAGAGACGVDTSFRGDAFPIVVDRSAGAVVVGMAEADGTVRAAVLDVLAPLTIVDPGPDQPVRIRASEFALLGLRTGPGGGQVARARLSTHVLETRLCAEASCAVGPSALPIGAVIGAEALAGEDTLDGDALRLRLGDDQLFILPFVAGSARDRSEICDAVFPAPLAGGGILVPDPSDLGGTTLSFAARRTVVEACLAPAPSAQIASQRGTDLLLALSTGLGGNLLAESAYLRYRDAQPVPPPALADLPSGEVRLASGLLTGRVVVMPALALVATASQTPRGGCREVWAHHLLTASGEVCDAGGDCPCEAGRSCSAPALVELTPATGLPFLVVPDTSPLLQALRDELRPASGELDGLLGADAMTSAEVDLDYPNNRMLWRCVDPGCVARPTLSSTAVLERTLVQACIDSAP
ncbi:MAG: hypothetical protein KA297_02020 [Kofleriaceae bacterium]|nr:hypothetical protein [Kofleriaceae bacterium]